jgi:hypothetical protein
MKRKIKKFNEGGFAQQALTIDNTPGFGAKGGDSGGIAGMNRSLQDISFGSNQVESGLNTIRSGAGGGGLRSSGPPAGPSGFYKNLMGENRANAIPMQDAANYALQKQAQGLKKGGMVKAKSKTVKSTASKRGDGIATKGKTRGRMV